jgi:hypothetical protein
VEGFIDQYRWQHLHCLRCSFSLSNKLLFALLLLMHVERRCRRCLTAPATGYYIILQAGSLFSPNTAETPTPQGPLLPISVLREIPYYPDRGGGRGQAQNRPEEYGTPFLLENRRNAAISVFREIPYYPDRGGARLRPFSLNTEIGSRRAELDTKQGVDEQLTGGSLSSSGLRNRSASPKLAGWLWWRA